MIEIIFYPGTYIHTAARVMVAAAEAGVEVRAKFNDHPLKAVNGTTISDILTQFQEAWQCQRQS